MTSTRSVKPPPLVLYQRDDCHLCDLALEELAAARVPEFESVFIDGDDALESRYGARVPVLRDTRRDVELDWPFDRDALRRWCALALAVALPVAAVPAAAAEDVHLVKAVAPAPDWSGRSLAGVFAGDAIERIVLTRAVTSAPADRDFAAVRDLLARTHGPARAGREPSSPFLAVGRPESTWEGLLLMRSGAIHAFAIGGDELCLHGAGGVRACWHLDRAIRPD